MTSPIIKSSLVKLNAPAARVRQAAGERHNGRKTARLVEVDGRVRAIEVTCACGETTLVELAFESPTPAGGDPS
jgi:hypothetical protein